MGRKVIAIFGPLKFLAPLCRMLLSEYLVLCRFLLSVGFAIYLVCRMCSLLAYCSWLRFCCVAKNCSWNSPRFGEWIASLPSAFQIIRCLGIWMSILLVNSWGLAHVSKLRGCLKYFKCVMVAFLEGSPWALCWPGLATSRSSSSRQTPVLSSCRTVFPKGLRENLIFTHSVWFLEMLWWQLGIFRVPYTWL